MLASKANLSGTLLTDFRAVIARAVRHGITAWSGCKETIFPEWIDHVISEFFRAWIFSKARIFRVLNTGMRCEVENVFGWINYIPGLALSKQL